MSRRPGFFIPHRYADRIRSPAGYPALAPLFVRAEPEFRARLAAAARHIARLLELGGEPPPGPRWDQDWFPRLDAAIAYVMVREARPGRIVEVGAGHSTRFLARAIADGAMGTRLTAIDPAPRTALAGLGIDLVRHVAQEAPPALFASLAAGDMLFADSSHILVPGSDVDFLLNAVLPAAPAGVFVHFHDVFLPDAYPGAWGWRGYNEHNALGPLIAAGGYRLLWASHYVGLRMAGDIAAAGLDRLPLPQGAHESSLWLEKL